MQREKVKKMFRTMEDQNLHIIELAGLLKILADPELISDTGKFIYLITDILFRECDRLDAERVQLEMACLD